MITLSKFISKYQGKRVDVPWAILPSRLKGQCVSLIQRYIKECLGQPAKARGNAVDWINTYVNQGLGQIVSTPQYGDILVFSQEGNGNGHIAIYINSNTLFDQNNGRHDNGCAGYGVIFSNIYTILRPNAQLISESVSPIAGVYRTNFNLNIRKTPNGLLEKVKNCTSAMKNALTSNRANSTAVIKAGTNITIISVIKVGETYWGKNYSGYVAIKNNDTEYCTKI